MKIRPKMIIWIAVPTLVIYVVIMGATLLYLRGQARLTVQHDLARKATHFAAALDGHLREVARIADTTARALEPVPEVSEPQLYELLRRNVEQNPLVFGACVAFEPGTFREDDALFAPYVCRAAGGLAEMNIDQAVYDWYRDPKWTWFREAKTTGLFEWAGPGGEPYGLYRLRAAIQANASRPVGEIIRDLYESVRAFAGDAPQMDDVTAVVIRRTAGPKVDAG